MAMILRVLVGLVGLFNVLIGLAFMAAPAKMAQAFFLAPLGSDGMATLRADFPGFFITGGVFALIGALRSDARAMLVPMLLLATALTGRFVSLVSDGVGPGAIPPMIAEAVMLLALGLCRRSVQGR